MGEDGARKGGAYCRAAAHAAGEGDVAVDGEFPVRFGLDFRLCNCQAHSNSKWIGWRVGQADTGTDVGRKDRATRLRRCVHDGGVGLNFGHRNGNGCSSIDDSVLAKKYDFARSSCGGGIHAVALAGRIF